MSGTLKEVLAVFESGAQVVDSSGGVILNLALTKIAFLISVKHTTETRLDWIGCHYFANVALVACICLDSLPR